MADQLDTINRPKARLPRGLTDSTGKTLAIHEELIAKLSRVYASYGFERLATPWGLVRSVVVCPAGQVTVSATMFMRKSSRV